jgi:hypothetical protein
MKAMDRYHKWVEWSNEDKAYIGKCPDVITGIHGDDPLVVYQELGDVVQDVISFIGTKCRFRKSDAADARDHIGS